MNLNLKREQLFTNTGENSSDEDVLEVLNPTHGASQSFETLMSSLYILNTIKPLKTVLFTSSQPGEGKTTITVNLAFTMMSAGKNILVVDADLRKPRIHRLLRLDNSFGFGDVLANNLKAEDVIHVEHFVEAGNEGNQSEKLLSVITSGRTSPNYFSTMGLPSLKEAIEHLKSRYDTILLDSPPVLSVSDPALLAPMVDGVILILDTGAVAERDVKRAKDRLEQAGAHIVGVVLNRFDERVFGPGYHPYYYSYYDRVSVGQKDGNNRKRHRSLRSKQ